MSASLRRPLTSTDHKYLRGVVGVVAGSAKYPGAAVLTVGGARHGGSGYVKFLDTDHFVTSLVLQRFPDVVPISKIDGERIDALVVGPGGAELTDIPDSIPVVFDSGALARARSKRNGVTVITPHEGELEALGYSLGDRKETAEKIARDLNLIVVLKGNRSLIAAPDCETLVDEIGGPELATAGTGDILAGLIGSMLASWKPTTLKQSQQAVARAVELHSRAGALAAKRFTSVTALEVMESLPQA